MIFTKTNMNNIDYIILIGWNNSDSHSICLKKIKEVAISGVNEQFIEFKKTNRSFAIQIIFSSDEVANVISDYYESNTSLFDKNILFLTLEKCHYPNNAKKTLLKDPLFKDKEMDQKIDIQNAKDFLGI